MTTLKQKSTQQKTHNTVANHSAHKHRMMYCCSAFVLIALGVVAGGRVGVIMSYWFAPELMHLYLGWVDYADAVASLMAQGDPLELASMLTTAHFLGSVGGGLVAFAMHQGLVKIRNRKNKHV